MDMPVIPANSLFYPAFTAVWLIIVSNLLAPLCPPLLELAFVIRRISTYLHEYAHFVGGLLAYNGHKPVIVIQRGYIPTAFPPPDIEPKTSYLGIVAWAALPKIYWLFAWLIVYYEMNVPQPLPMAILWATLTSAFIMAGNLSKKDRDQLPPAAYYFIGICLDLVYVLVPFIFLYVLVKYWPH